MTCKLCNVFENKVGGDFAHSKVNGCSRAQSPFDGNVSSAVFASEERTQAPPLNSEEEVFENPRFFSFLFSEVLFFCCCFIGGETVATRLARGYQSINVWTDRQTEKRKKYRQTERQKKEMQTDRQKDRKKKDRQTDRKTRDQIESTRAFDNNFKILQNVKKGKKIDSVS